jgi:hypothetical protein
MNFSEARWICSSRRPPGTLSAAKKSYKLWNDKNNGFAKKEEV